MYSPNFLAATTSLLLFLVPTTTASLDFTLYNLPSCESHYLGTTRANGVLDYGADYGWPCDSLIDPYSGDELKPASYVTKSLKISSLPKGCTLKLFGGDFKCEEKNLVEAYTKEPKGCVELPKSQVVWSYNLTCAS